MSLTSVSVYVQAQAVGGLESELSRAQAEITALQSELSEAAQNHRTATQAAEAQHREAMAQAERGESDALAEEQRRVEEVRAVAAEAARVGAAEASAEL